MKNSINVKMVPLLHLASLEIFVLQMTAGLMGTSDHTPKMIHIVSNYILFLAKTLWRI